MMGHLVGLKNDSPGFKSIRVEPAIIPGLDWAEGRFESAYGTVSNRWERNPGRITLRLAVPPNSTADVILPKSAEKITYQGWRVSSLENSGSGIHEFTWKENP